MLPEPYYKDEFVTVYHADCRKYIDELPKFDLIISDPPYGMAWAGAQRIQKFKVIFGDNEPFDTDVLKKLIAKSNNATFIFCRWNNLAGFMAAEVPEPKSFIACVKNNWTLGDLEHEYARQWEGCCYWANAGHKWADGRPTDFIQYNRVAGNDLIHPTQKPVSLITQLIERNVGGTILDPYGGSLTTAVAAKMLGRRCVIFEIDEEFCKRGVDRLRQEMLFSAPQHNTAKQTSLIKEMG